MGGVYRSIYFRLCGWELLSVGGFNSLNHLAQYALLFSTVPILCLYAVMALWAGSALTPAVRIAQNRDRAVTAGSQTRASGRVAAGSDHVQLS